MSQNSDKSPEPKELIKKKSIKEPSRKSTQELNTTMLSLGSDDEYE